jgi:hypothetical protein
MQSGSVRRADTALKPRALGVEKRIEQPVVGGV